MEFEHEISTILAGSSLRRKPKLKHQKQTLRLEQIDVTPYSMLASQEEAQS